MVAALFALSLMAKPMLVTLPLVMLLLDYWPLKSIWISDLNPKSKIQNPKSFRFLLGEKLPLLVLSAASSVVTVFAQQHSGAVQPLSNLSFGRRLANAIDSYFMYLVDMLWPLNLVAQHPHPGLIPIWRTSIAAAILLAITAMCVWQIRRRPYLIVGWLWYLGTLVPVIGLVQVGGHARADRYTYVPLIGVFIMVCWLIPSAGASVRKSRATMTAMAGTALIVLGSLTFLTVPQCAVWKDSMTFWTAIIERGVQSTFAYNNRGSIHTRAGRLNDAEADYRKAIEISPTHAEAIYNLGSVLNEQGRPDEALIAYAEAVRIKSDFADAHYNAGNIHKARRAFEAAVACYSAAIAARPSYAEARTNMAGALHFLNRLDEAEVQYREALRLNPRIILAYDGLARVLLFKGKHAEAIELLRAGFKVDPSYAPIRELLTQYDTQPPPPPGP
jgi:Tfp pilus assembly protein PilF